MNEVLSVSMGVRSIVVLCILVGIRADTYAQQRVTAQNWEEQARTLAIATTGDASIARPSGIEPAPVNGDTLLVDLETGAASGWKYDYAYGDFSEDGNSRRVMHVTVQQGYEPEVVVPTVWYVYHIADNLYPLPEGWVDSDRFLELAATAEYEGWSLDAFTEAYADASAIEFRAAGGSRGPQNGYDGRWTVRVRSVECGMHMGVTYLADGSRLLSMGRPELHAPGYCAEPVATEDADKRALSFEPNHPNPFAQTTTIPFTVATPSFVRIEVFDLLGRSQALLADGPYPAGRHQVEWEADSQSSGVYLYRIVVGDEHHVGTMTLMR